MSDLLPVTRHALLCLPPAVAEGGPVRRVLGRWLGEWQVDHAVDTGCTGLFILGGGGGPEAVATRLAAERQGLKVREIATPHALAGAVAPGELLLVLQPQLLPSDAGWSGQADHRGLVPTFVAAPAVEAGFERIDLARAWAGAMLVPGHAVQRLLDLPEDVEAAPALLRIALQAAVPELRLPEPMIANGAWPLLGRGVPVRLHEEKWLSQRLSRLEDDTLSGHVLRAALRHWGAPLPGKPVALPAVLGAGGLLAAGGVAAAWSGAAAAGFALIAVGALAVELAGIVAALQRGRERALRVMPVQRRVIDAALLACGYPGVEGRWFRQLFPALVLVMALNLPHRHGPRRWWQAALADRPLVAGVVALLAFGTSPEVGMMLAGTLLLAANLVRPRG